MDKKITKTYQTNKMEPNQAGKDSGDLKKINKKNDINSKAIKDNRYQFPDHGDTEIKFENQKKEMPKTIRRKGWEAFKTGIVTNYLEAYKDINEKDKELKQNYFDKDIKQHIKEMCILNLRNLNRNVQSKINKKFDSGNTVPDVKNGEISKAGNTPKIKSQDAAEPSTKETIQTEKQTQLNLKTKIVPKVNSQSISLASSNKTSKCEKSKIKSVSLKEKSQYLPNSLKKEPTKTEKDISLQNAVNDAQKEKPSWKTSTKEMRNNEKDISLWNATMKNTPETLIKENNVEKDISLQKTTNKTSPREYPQESSKAPKETATGKFIRKPIIKTITTRNDAKVFKAVTFVDSKKTQQLPLQIKIPNDVQKISRTTDTNSLVSRIVTPNTVTEKPVILKKGKRKERRLKHAVSPDASKGNRINSPPTEVARWAPSCINHHTKPYYEAWVDTTLAAIPKNSEKDKLIIEKEKIIQSLRKALENKLHNEDLIQENWDEKYTGRIKIRQK